MGEEEGPEVFAEEFYHVEGVGEAGAGGGESGGVSGDTKSSDCFKVRAASRRQYGICDLQCFGNMV